MSKEISACWRVHSSPASFDHVRVDDPPGDDEGGHGGAGELEARRPRLDPRSRRVGVADEQDPLAVDWAGGDEALVVGPVVADRHRSRRQQRPVLSLEGVQVAEGSDEWVRPGSVSPRLK